MAHSAHGTAHELRETITKAERKRKGQKEVKGTMNQENPTSAHKFKNMNKNGMRHNIGTLYELYSIREERSFIGFIHYSSISAHVLWDSRNI